VRPGRWPGAVATPGPAIKAEKQPDHETRHETRRDSEMEPAPAAEKACKSNQDSGPDQGCEGPRPEVFP
jgi:hypothetical protein